MSKTKKQLPITLETKFTNLVLNPVNYQELYSLDHQTVKTLSSLHQWQKDFIIKSFINGSKKTAIEQFPNMETTLMTESLKFLIKEAQDIQQTINQDKDTTLIYNPNDPVFTLDTDSNKTTFTLGKKGKITLQINIAPEDPFKGDINNIDDLITLVKTIWKLFLEFIEDKTLDAQEFVENCERELSNFLDRNSYSSIKNNFDYLLDDKSEQGLHLSGEYSAEELSLSDD